MPHRNDGSATRSLLDGIKTQIHPDDEMYLNALKGLANPELARSVYFRQGAEIRDTVRQIADWRFGGLGKVPALLDFACGYGRVTRFLLEDLQPSHIWVSDIYAGAVAFQKSTFGVNGFVSVTEPETLQCDQRFDLIFVASLFTHLNERRFKQWLRALFGLLSDTGVLAFSVHDEALARGLSMPPSGLHFVSASESMSLDKNEYGTNFVTEAFVRRMVDETARAGWPLQRLPRALCGAHDVYLVSRDAAEQFTSFHYQYPPVGYVDLFTRTEHGQLQASGWAGEPNEGRQVLEVQVCIEGKLVARGPVNRARPDVAQVLGMPKFASSGWTCLIDPQAVGARPADTVEIRAVSDAGTSALLHLSPVSAAMPLPMPAAGPSEGSSWLKRLARRLIG